MDSRTHNCPICGRPVAVGGSYRCTECGRLDLCDYCVTTVPGVGFQKYVCRDCITQKGWACSYCGNYSRHVCIICGRRACDGHRETLFAWLEKKSVYARACPACVGLVCKICAKVKSGVFSTKYNCPKCGSELVETQGATSISRTCRFCGTVIGPEGTFCPRCGKSQS